VITVRIARSQRQFPTDDVDEAWLNKQFKQQDEDPLCVQIAIRSNTGVNVIVSTPGCPTSRSAPRSPKPREREILELWNELLRCHGTLHSGNVIAFLKQVRRML